MRKQIALTLTLVAGLTGCGMLPGPLAAGGEEKQQVTAQQTTAQQSGGTPQESGTAPAPQTAQSAPPEQTQVIAGREVKAGGADLLVQITGLKRQGRVATLTWTVTNKGENRWEMSSTLGDTPMGMGLTVGGVSLVDAANGKRYRVAYTGKAPGARCMCSDYDVFTEPGEQLPLHATFAAPPADVTKVNVDLRTLGVFTDVPVS
ncbi:hypothetical protein [Nonomuraea dietziae]|uniref:hypothetical protein n=1 Tax=Nonomuraea dietziae TaxID=65515 RepID=UPI003435559E